MSSAKRVTVNTAFLYARMAITMFISLYSTRLILSALGAEDFGIFNVIGGAIAMLTFLNAAMSSASQRFMSYAQGEGNVANQKSIFNVSVLLHVIIGILVVLLLESVSYFLFNGILNIDPERIQVAKMIFHFMVVSTFFNILSVPYDAVINARENMLLVAILGVIAALLNLGIAIYITRTEADKLMIYGLLMALSPIFLLILRSIYCHQKYDEVQINLGKYYNKQLFKNMTSFAGWSFLGGSSSLLTNYGQGIVLNMFFGTVVNAAQGVANQVSAQLSLFAVYMQKALNPVIAKSEGAGDRKLMLRASIMGNKISFFLLMFFYVPIMLEMSFVFNFWLKEVPDFTIIFCKLLLFRRLIEQMYQQLTASIAAVGDIKKYEIIKSINNLYPLFISYILFKMDFPPYAIYCVFLVYALTDGIITIYFAKTKCGLSISYFMKFVVLRCGGSFVLVLLCSSLPLLYFSEGFLRLVLISVLSLIFFVVFVWFIGFTSEEKTSILQLIRSFLIKSKVKKVIN